jgi:hypothetical protein
LDYFYYCTLLKRRLNFDVLEVILKLKLFLLATSIAAARAAMAATAFSSYPATGGYYFIGGYAPELQFQAVLGGSLTGFDMGVVDYTASGPQDYLVSLYSDSGGSPAALLGSWTGVTNGTDVDPVAASGVTLSAGSFYWLQASYGAIGDFSNYPDLIWDASAGGHVTGWDDPEFYTSPSLSPQMAFAVNVSTPGPEAVIPFGLGLVTLLRRRRRA